MLDGVPDAMIVLTSAWRYFILNGWMTLRGFEYLLLTHGIKCTDRIVGCTEADPETFRAEDHKPPFDAESWRARGLKWRAQQIYDYIHTHDVKQFVVLDDLPLSVPNLVITDGLIGLTDDHIHRVVNHLTQQNEAGPIQ